MLAAPTSRAATTPTAMTSIRRMPAIVVLFDYPVRLGEHARGKRQRDRARSRLVHDQLVSGRLLDGQVGGLCTPEDAVDEIRGAAIVREDVGTVGGETACLGCAQHRMDHRQAVAHGALVNDALV